MKMDDKQFLQANLPAAKIALAIQKSDFFLYEPLLFANKSYDKLLKSSLCKVTDVEMDDKLFLQAILPAAKIALADQNSYICFVQALVRAHVFCKQELRQITKKFGMQGH